MALLGLLLSVFYSVKPPQFAYRGVGELALFLGYGPTLTLGAAYVQSGYFSKLAMTASVVPGLLMWAMILVNEIPDYWDDVRGGKLNLTVRLGPARARWLYVASLAGVYAFLVGGVFFGAFPNWTLLALGSAPFALHSFRITVRNYRNPRAMVPANKAMVLTYSSTMLLFCFGFWLGSVT